MIQRTTLFVFFACLVCVQLVEAQNVRYNVDGQEILVQNATSNRDGDNATMSCTVEGYTSYETLFWYKDGVLLKPEGEKPKYLVSQWNGTLMVTKIERADIGIYNCQFEKDVQNYSASVSLFAAPRIDGSHESKSKNLVQGGPLVLECKVWADPEFTISWYKGDTPINETDTRVTISNATWGDEVIPGGKLRIDEMDYPDRDDYMCVAENMVGSTNHTTLVRVKDKLAALWPFLGICAEVAILCAIIFIYEKKRAKQLEAEERQEEADHLTNSNDHKGTDELRHRK